MKRKIVFGGKMSKICYLFLFCIVVGVVNSVVSLKELNYLTLFVPLIAIAIDTFLPRKLKDKKTTFLRNLTLGVLVSSIIARYNVGYGLSILSAAVFGAVFFTFPEKFTRYASQITYFWIGGMTGFIIAVISFRNHILPENEKAHALLGLVFGLGFTTLLIGKLVNYKPFSERVRV